MAEYNAGLRLGNAASGKLNSELMRSSEVLYADLLLLTVGHRDFVCTGSGKLDCGCDLRMRFSSRGCKKSRSREHQPCRELTSAEIDRDVNQYSSHGKGLYRVDIRKLEAIKPDLIVTQELCDVCAISTSYVAKAVYQLSSKPQVLSLTPHTLGDMLDDVLRVGEATDRDAEARALVS